MTKYRLQMTTKSLWKCAQLKTAYVCVLIALGVVSVNWGAPSLLSARDLSARDTAERVGQTTERGPIEVVLLEEQRRLVAINQMSNTLSLLDLESGQVLDEVNCGDYPVSLQRCVDDSHVVVSCAHAGVIQLFRVEGKRLIETGSVDVGFDPRGLACSTTQPIAYVSLRASGEIAEIDLEGMKKIRVFPVGRWPNHLTLSADGDRLAVACNGESKIRVLDRESGEELYNEPLSSGINMGQMITSKDGVHVYFPWMVYRSNPISRRNIQQGWVLASRIGRVRMDGSSYREAISLDVPRRAVADPYGLVISPDENRMVTSSAGTHELLVYRLPDLPFIGVGGPGDLVDRKLLDDRDLFYRIEVGGRPMGMAMSDDGRTVYVANYLRHSIQKVDIESKSILDEFELGSMPDPTLVSRGREIFYDAQFSLDQWYSCHSCHQDGGVNSKSMDTMNDGTQLTAKTVLPLYNVTRTSPWTWHGWQEDLRDSVHRSFTSTMQGEAVDEDVVDAVIAYLETLETPPNPFSGDKSSREAVARGKEIFEGTVAACADCHSGPYFSDGEIHDVGLGAENDRYEGFNTPSLLGTYGKIRYLHDGRAKTLERVLTGPHAPDVVSGTRALTDEEVADLVAYLKTL